MAFGQKIIACPSCSQRIRLPMVLNKTLRIRCQSCKGEFEVKLQSPFLNLFSWNKKENPLRNAQAFIGRFHRLPFKPKLFLTTFSFFMLWFLGSIVSLIVKKLAS